MPQSGGITPAKETESIRPDHLLKRSLSVIAQICGWVILFRMLITFIDEWFGFIIPISVQPLLYGLLEITNGCLSLHLIPDSGIRFIICSVMLAMGGFCVTMQTASIISQNLKLSHYCFGKLMQAAISAALSAFVAVTFIQHKAIYLYPLFFRDQQNIHLPVIFFAFYREHPFDMFNSKTAKTGLVVWKIMVICQRKQKAGDRISYAGFQRTLS